MNTTNPQYTVHNIYNRNPDALHPQISVSKTEDGSPDRCVVASPRLAWSVSAVDLRTLELSFTQHTGLSASPSSTGPKSQSAVDVALRMLQAPDRQGRQGAMSPDRPLADASVQCDLHEAQAQQALQAAQQAAECEASRLRLAGELEMETEAVSLVRLATHSTAYTYLDSSMEYIYIINYIL